MYTIHNDELFYHLLHAYTVSIIFVCIGIIELGVEIFQAKIGISNQPSLKFFKEKLAFVEVCTYNSLSTFYSKGSSFIVLLGGNSQYSTLHFVCAHFRAASESLCPSVGCVQDCIDFSLVYSIACLSIGQWYNYR